MCDRTDMLPRYQSKYINNHTSSDATGNIFEACVLVMMFIGLQTFVATMTVSCEFSIWRASILLRVVHLDQETTIGASIRNSE